MTGHPAERHLLVTGGTGQIGLELARLAWPRGVIPHFPKRTDCDLTCPKSIAQALATRDYACVINCAAWTAVDAAEDHVSEAYIANALGPAWLAEETAARGIPLVHVSTDYVFAGTLDRPYAEDDATGPQSIYGVSKLAGEMAVRAANPRSVILRTAWVLSAHRGNFLKTMLRLAAERTELSVVADQIGCPTAAADLADALQTIALRLIEDAAAPTGTYHFVNAGAASWHQLACAIIGQASATGRPSPVVHPIATTDYPTRARRPANSRLGTARLARDYRIEPRPWQHAVADIVREVLPTSPPPTVGKGTR